VQEVEVGASSVVLKGEGWQLAGGSLIVAAGAWCGEIPGLPNLPVRPVRGQMLRVSGVPWDFRGTLRSPQHYAVRRGAHDLLVGASVEEAGFDCRTTVGGLAKLFEFVLRYLPRLTDRPAEEIWAGLRPGTPDGLPLVGRCGDSPVYAATGHFRNGILLAPWTATAIACLLRGLEPPAELAAFSPDRFAAGPDRF
jgi:glycine oxidase